ncbi:DUF4126 domain-containing protein [Robiginitalea aurantiaca]|uniref:DUF4126 domain-containing protein n=1 Tax=Robiginitalea aurantiaca TaxID=3056915 RepID=A0ABT7WHQ5_9FLAO|nr:DUF4126 domain-containing protein [Robiginitalea aurantiaca]MDM9632460.1 DUF4126 domain-containing protein [Robiginitalea aurantiaca]
MSGETMLSVFLGIGLAASAGFRVFVPLFALSLASYAGLWELNENWEWMGSLTAIVITGVATLAEVFGYFIPWIDNLLDSLAIPLAALAGTAVMVSTLTGMDPVITWTLAIIAGGGTASVIKGAAAGTRLTSTVSTGGIANPAVSAVETAAATTISLVSILAPVLATLLVIVVLAFVFRIYRKLRPERRGSR